MSNRMPVTRSLQIVDRVLSFLIIAMGLVMVYLTLTTGNVMLALASLIFLTVGFFKIRDLIPAAFRTIRKTGPTDQTTYKQILLPISRPEAAGSIVRMASDVLGPGGKLAIINVVVLPPQLPTEAEVTKDRARALLKEAAGHADRLGIESKAEIVSARTATEAILNRAREYRSNLIIMGSSQRTTTEKMLFGNVADVVLRQAPCDVMVLSYVDRQHPAQYSNILVPTAGYRHSQRALDVAIDIVKKEGGSITSLYVGSGADAEKGKQILDEARQRAEARGVKIETKYLMGNTADVIIERARKGGYALIIIGATEHPRYYSALLGNIADVVVKRASCDVLVVRTKQ